MASNDPRYAAVNARSYPPLTRAQAFIAARQILAKLGAPNLCAVQGIDDASGAPMFPARSVLSNIFGRWTGWHRDQGRTCWASTKPTTGHHKGWGRLIHDVSHMLHEYRHPGERAHGGSHPGIEREVAECVDRNAMLERFNSKRAPRDRDAERAQRLAHMHARLARWITKRKRAEAAISKLTRSIKATERRASAAIKVGTTVSGAGVVARLT